MRTVINANSNLVVYDTHGAGTLIHPRRSKRVRDGLSLYMYMCGLMIEHIIKSLELSGFC